MFNYFNKFLRQYRQHRLRNTMKVIEKTATERKMWGSNFDTMIVLNELTTDNMMLFNEDAFKQSIKKQVINVAFDDYSDLMEWLSDVRNVLKRIARRDITSIPENQKHLVLNKFIDVPFVDFMTNSKDVINIRGYLNNLNTLLSGPDGITTWYDELEPSMKHYVNMRFGNGINTILVIHEKTLEVMINDEQIS